MEEELNALHDEMARPEFFRGDPDTIRQVTARSSSLAEEIDEAFRRWAELDERATN